MSNSHGLDRTAVLSLTVSCAVAIAIAAVLLPVGSRQASMASSQAAAYEALVHNPNPVIVCRDGTVLLLNSAAEQALNVKAADVVGTNVVDSLVPELYRARHKAAMSRIAKLPDGETGDARYILPVKYADGRMKKWWVTVAYRVDNGSVVSVARFVNYGLESEKTWLDVETMRMFRAALIVDPVTVAGDSSSSQIGVNHAQDR